MTAAFTIACHTQKKNLKQKIKEEEKCKKEKRTCTTRATCKCTFNIMYIMDNAYSYICIYLNVYSTLINGKKSYLYFYQRCCRIKPS